MVSLVDQAVAAAGLTESVQQEPLVKVVQEEMVSMSFLEAPTSMSLAVVAAVKVAQEVTAQLWTSILEMVMLKVEPVEPAEKAQLQGRLYTMLEGAEAPEQVLELSLLMAEVREAVRKAREVLLVQLIAVAVVEPAGVEPQEVLG
jgi:hypothetical protein